MLALFYEIFGVIFGGHFGGVPNEKPSDVAMAMFLGLILYQLLADTLATAPLIVISTPNLVKKVVFPLDILPLAQMGAFWFNLLIGLVLAIGGAAIFGRGVSIVGLAWLPVIVLPLIFLSAGLAFAFSALGVFFRDLAQFMPFVAQVVLYASAVFYPLSRLTPAAWMILKWNPFLETVVLAREVVLWGLPVHGTRLAYTYACGLVVFAAGRWIFMKLQPAFADVI